MKADDGARLHGFLFGLCDNVGRTGAGLSEIIGSFSNDDGDGGDNAG